MVDFKTLETFMWVANLRSFRGAAEKLNTTQPAVSMRIAQLEEDLGVRLLERDRRLVSPTEKGTAPARLCRSPDPAPRRDGRGGRRPHDDARHRPARRIGDDRPHVAADADRARECKLIPISNSRSKSISRPFARPAGRRAYLGLLLGPISNPGVHSRPLCSFPLAFVAGDRIKFGRKNVPLVELAKWPIITFSRNTQPYIFVRELFDRAGLQPTIHASASLATVVRMALDGIGVAVIPPAILANVVAGEAAAPAEDGSGHFPTSTTSSAGRRRPDSFAAQKVAEIATRVAQGAPDRQEPLIRKNYRN